MTLLETQGALKHFRKISWRYQQTFRTPLKNLRPFVAGIVFSLRGIEEVTVTFDEVVFEARKLNAFLAGRSIAAPTMSNTHYLRDWSLSNIGVDDFEELLNALLGDWVDFIFVPAPCHFAIFADHDEYATFFSNKKSHLSHLASSLLAAGFSPLNDYVRRI